MSGHKGVRQYNDLTKSVWTREGVGLEQSETRRRRDAKLGSQILREACLDLFQRTANKYMIRMDDAMACHLGYHSRVVIPGTERVYRGQGAERALAA